MPCCCRVACGTLTALALVNLASSSEAMISSFAKVVGRQLDNMVLDNEKTSLLMTLANDFLSVRGVYP